MANIIKYNTRVMSKHDAYGAWDEKEEFIPLAGEIIVYDADANNTEP